MQLDKGEFRGPVDGDEEIELAFFGSHLGKCDMEEADWVALELVPRRLAPLDTRKLADAMTPDATMQRGSCQTRDGRLCRRVCFHRLSRRIEPDLPRHAYEHRLCR